MQKIVKFSEELASWSLFDIVVLLGYFFLLLKIIMCHFHGICKSHLDGKEISLGDCVKMYFVFAFKGSTGEN